MALWQAEFISQKLKEGGLDSTLIPISTKGDKILDVTLSKIGSKGVFTEELEQLLANNEADIAVHSAKDLQSTLPTDFEILAFSEREKVNDVLVSQMALDLNQPLVIGTSSTRRVAYLKHQFSHFKVVDMRGNLQTRISKMERGDCDALLLAYAGVHRMGYSDMIQHVFDSENFTPAVGQGSLAIECHHSLNPSLQHKIRLILNHTETAECVTAERAYLAAMNGGCSIPVFGYAKKHEGTITLSAGIIDLKGLVKLQETLHGEDPIALGIQMGNKILSKGGDKILKEIKEQLNQ